jgi:hypothetical protein
MKKFSSVIGDKIPEEPKVEINPEERKINLIKGKLLTLMDDLLKIQSSGAARTELVNSAITITGKEVLADAIIDVILGEFGNEKIKLLESLKLDISDWYTLDKKISNISTEITQDKNQNHLNLERKIVTFLEIYSDERDFELFAEKYSNRVKDSLDIKNRIMITESILNNSKYNRLEKEKVKILLNKFKKRSKF